MTDSNNDDSTTLLARVELCEDGLRAVETILRASFPQFFEDKQVEHHDNTEPTEGASEGPREAGKEAVSEKEDSSEA